MRALVVLGLLAMLGGGGDARAPRLGASDDQRQPRRENTDADTAAAANADASRAPRFADLGSSAAGIFLKLVNEQLEGRIDPRSIAYVAPAGIVLEDTVLTAPGRRPVAKVKRVQAQVSIRALLSGEIAISKLEIDEPQLLLEVKDGKVNLLEALTPKKKTEKKGDSSGSFRIDDIQVRKGGFRLNADENVTLVFDGINGAASLDVDLAHDSVYVDVRGLKVGSGSVRLKQLDVPLRDVRAERVQVFKDRVQITGATGRALGGMGATATGPTARFGVAGQVVIKGDGDLRLKGNVDVDAGAWPDRLAPLDFKTPTVKGQVSVSGPFATPTIGVDGDLGATTAYNFPVDGGHATVRITPSRVDLESGTILRTGGGRLAVTGDVVFPTDADPDARLNLAARATAVPFATALSPARLDTRIRGTLSGALRLRGRAGKTTAIDVSGDVSGRQLQLYDVHLPAELDGDVKVAITPTRVQLERASFRDPLGGAAVDVGGDVHLKREELQLAVKASLADGPAVVPSLPPQLKARGVKADGTVTGPFKKVVVALNAAVDNGSAWGAPFRQVTAAVTVTPDEVRIQKGRGTLAGGALTQQEPLVLALGGTAKQKKAGPRFQSGRFLVRGASLERIKRPDGQDLPLTGVLDVEATLRGSTSAPRVLVRAAAGGLEVVDERLDDVTAAAVITRDALEITEGTVRGPMVRGTIDHFTMSFDDLRMSGVVDIESLQLAAISHAQSLRLAGVAAGAAFVSGTASTPAVRAPLSVRGLQVGDFGFGDGPVTVGIAPDPLGGDGALQASVSLKTAWALGLWDLRAAYAVERQTLAAAGTFRDVDLSLMGDALDDVVYPLEGRLNGAVDVAGSLAALTGTVKVQMPDLAVRVPSATEEKGFVHRALGPIRLDARLDEGALAARLCAFPDASVADTSALESPCATPHRVWANIAGDLQLDAPSVNLAVDARIAEGRFEDLVVALREQGVGVGGAARIAASFSKAPDEPAVTALATTLESLRVRAPGAPEIRLAQPVELALSEGRVMLGARAARFVTTQQGVNLEIAAGSSVGKEDIDLAVDGELALSTLKLVTDQIANAAGTAISHLRVTGRYADGVLIDGSIAPRPGARITPRALGQPLTFESARIRLAPNGSDLTRLRVSLDAPCPDDRASTCPLIARLGDGRVQLAGDLIARTSRKDDETWVERFNLGMSASAVQIKTSLGRVETSFDVALAGDAPAPVLKGRVEVSDGLLRKDFQVRNFILTQAPERPSEPLWQTLTPLGLGGLTFDLDCSMQNVRAKARINSFQLDASLRGDLRVTRSLRLPSLDGAVEVESGTVDFPRARFEIVEMQLQFPTSADGRIKPTVHLSATTEFPPGSTGNDVEIPVELTLDGGFDAMQLDLTATDSNRQWTRAELFAYILFGVVPADAGGADLVATSVSVAQRAAISELTAPVNQELEDLVQQNLGLDVNIDVASGVQLQLGGRLVLEGLGFLSTTLASTDTTTSSTTTGTVGADALRGRLLIYDHLPVGRSVSVEGRLGTVSELRLSWRVFEQ